MWRRLAMAAACVGLSACADLAPRIVGAADLPPSGAERDPGGNVVLRLAAIGDLVARGEAYTVAVKCESACAAFTGAPLESGICFDPEGVVRVHSVAPDMLPPEVLEAFPEDTEAALDYGNRLLASMLAPTIRAAFLAPGGPADTRSSAFLEFRVSDLVERGEVRPCSR